MGNCQAALGIQHPGGRMERMHGSVTSRDVMEMNPGHYVSQIMPFQHHSGDDQTVLSFARVKLLRPHESLVLGRAYRLVTTQEVIEVIRAKKYGKMKSRHVTQEQGYSTQQHAKGIQLEDHAQRQRSRKFAAARSKSWRPSLYNIPEAGI